MTNKKTVTDRLIVRCSGLGIMDEKDRLTVQDFLVKLSSIKQHGQTKSDIQMIF